jgi:hypothetical protein
MNTTADKFYAIFMELMVLHVNENPKMDEVLFCREIADWINGYSFSRNDKENLFYMFDALHEFIYEHGEDEDMTYLGRDEYGEKIYHTFNPETNWHTRIRNELRALGFYVRCEAAQKEAAG